MTTAKAIVRTPKKARASEGTRGGFTIIEVVLVLAIAGLIFLMVFVALPQMQAAQRDTQRRSLMGQLTGAITSYQSNNNGQLPTSSSQLIGSGKYLDASTFVDPDTGSTFTLSFTTSAPTSPTLGTIYIIKSKKCGTTEGSVVAANGARNYAALMKLEQGVYCVDNS